MVNRNFTVDANGTLSVGGSAAITQNINLLGQMTITGPSTLTSGSVNVNPGAQAFFNNVTMTSITGLVIGTAAAPPPYADVKIFGNLSLNLSADVLVNRNGRFAIFGNVSDDGSGGTFITVENGGQAYVDGNISFSGGGNSIVNNNPPGPPASGLYVNGTITNTGGGATTTTNLDDKDGMQNNNLPFYNWVFNTPLPVGLTSFEVIAGVSGHVARWKTAYETENQGFLLEESTDGITFWLVQEVAGQGTSAKQHQYEIHFQPLHVHVPLLYYRLVQIDSDGTVHHFPLVLVRTLASAQSENLQVYPNPIAEQRFFVSHTSELIHGVELMTISGVNVFSFQPDRPERTIHILLPDLKKGIYLLSIQSTSGSSVKRIQIR